MIKFYLSQLSSPAVDQPHCCSRIELYLTRPSPTFHSCPSPAADLWGRCCGSSPWIMGHGSLCHITGPRNNIHSLIYSALVIRTMGKGDITIHTTICTAWSLYYAVLAMTGILNSKLMITLMSRFHDNVHNNETVVISSNLINAKHSQHWCTIVSSHDYNQENIGYHGEDK